MVIRDYGTEAGGWLEASLRMIGAEAGGEGLGAGLIALKVSEVIFAQALRAHIERSATADGELSGFADTHLVRALTSFHRNPSQNWTVEALAKEAALSRTGFAVRFSDKLGITPMQYVASWRMQMARSALSEQSITVAEAANLSGYASEAAFSRAFKKEFGQPPAAFKRLQ